MYVTASGTHGHPPTTLDESSHKTQTKTRQRGGCARRIRGGRAVRRRLRRSIGESGGEGWRAAEGRGRGRRRVEPWRGVGWQQQARLGSYPAVQPGSTAWILRLCTPILVAARGYRARAMLGLHAPEAL